MELPSSRGREGWLLLSKRGMNYCFLRELASAAAAFGELELPGAVGFGDGAAARLSSSPESLLQNI